MGKAKAISNPWHVFPSGHVGRLPGRYLSNGRTFTNKKQALRAAKPIKKRALERAALERIREAAPEIIKAAEQLLQAGPGVPKAHEKAKARLRALIAEARGES
jgi:hypothetical protein